MPRETGTEHFLQPRATLVFAIVILCAALRIVPHPMNFAPIGAMALFSGAYFSSKRAACLVPISALLAGDLVTGFHALIPWVYTSFLVSVAIGLWLRPKKSVARLGAATLAGAIQFFLITNFALWASAIGRYPKTSAGLAECYLAGLPLLANTLAGDTFYAAILFGGMALAGKRFPSLREPFSAMTGQTQSVL